MKIIEVRQGSQEWLEARMGLPTASEFDNLITPKGKVKEGEAPENYMYRKLVEKWTGQPLITWSGGAMEQGSLLEKEARPFYEFEYDAAIRTVGFVVSDCGRWGCSPDGLFDDDTGLEIKCPEAHTHIKYLLSGGLPDQYRAQVQGSMLVTGAVTWKFMSFCPIFSKDHPALVLTIDRDDEFCEKLEEALEAFDERLQAGYARLVKMYGEPKRRATLTKEQWDSIGER